MSLFKEKKRILEISIAEFLRIIIHVVSHRKFSGQFSSVFSCQDRENGFSCTSGRLDICLGIFALSISREFLKENQTVMMALSLILIEKCLTTFDESIVITGIDNRKVFVIGVNYVIVGGSCPSCGTK